MPDPGELIQRCEDLCVRRQRDDLVARLRSTAERWTASDVRVLVIGEFKQGKSQLVNALIGAPVCPVNDDIATSVPVTVRHGAEPSADLLWVPPGTITEDEPRRERVDIATLAGRVSVPGGDRAIFDTSGSRLVGAEVGIPRALLRDGLALVDTPGVGGPTAAHAAATRGILPSAHAILVVTDASQELTFPEVELIREAMAASPHVALVLTKTDLHAQWRQVQTLNERRLRDAGVDVRQLPVSSHLRQVAVSTKDADLHAESGFPELVSFLSGSVVARRDELGRSSVRHDLNSTLAALSSSLESEHRVLTSPEHLAKVVGELTEARQRADRLKKRSAKWQQTLGDGVADLNADMDHDLRDRIRVVQVEADRVIDSGDPGHAWPDFVRWLEHETAVALTDTFAWAEQNAEWLFQVVAEHFEAATHESLPELHLSDTGDLGDRIRPLGDLEINHVSFGGKFIIGMKGSYGGVLMFGILTGLAGMSLVNPISVGAGILLGGKAFRDDAESRINRRRVEAKNLVRKHLDEVIFQTSKVLRDRMRHTQWQVRDHFAKVAEDLSRSLGESVNNAQNAAKANDQEKKERLAALSTDQKALAELQRLVDALGDPASPTAKAASKGASKAPSKGASTGAPRSAAPSPAR